MIRTVHDEMTGEERSVKAACRRCKPSDKDIASGYFLLSPKGVAHIQNWANEDTLCGQDSTRDNWWWPL